jgi:hypothetical protein
VTSVRLNPQLLTISPAAVRLSPARVHQLLHMPVSSAAVRAITMTWDSSATQACLSRSPRRHRGPAARMHRMVDRLDREEFVAVNLSEATDPQTEYVAADRAQIRHVLLQIAGEIEGLAAGSTPAIYAAGASRRERLASLLPKPARLSPHEERALLRRQFGLEP